MNACRILDRLEKAELAEPDVGFRQDYRQVFICVPLASRGEPQPFIESGYRIYGSHPDDVWPKIMAQRKAKLGWEFDLWYFENGTTKPDVIIPDYDPLVPRKPPTHAEEFCIARLPSDAELKKVLRILPAA